MNLESFKWARRDGVPRGWSWPITSTTLSLTLVLISSCVAETPNFSPQTQPRSAPSTGGPAPVGAGGGAEVSMGGGETTKGNDATTQCSPTALGHDDSRPEPVHSTCEDDLASAGDPSRYPPGACCQCLSDEYPGDWDDGRCCGHCTNLCEGLSSTCENGTVARNDRSAHVSSVGVAPNALNWFCDQGTWRKGYQATGKWITCGITDMSDWFHGHPDAVPFDADLSAWDISNVVSMKGMFAETKLSTKNYDAMLMSWSEQNVQRGVVFDAGSSTYSPSAADARARLIVKHAWVISDGGLSPWR